MDFIERVKRRWQRVVMAWYRWRCEVVFRRYLRHTACKFWIWGSADPVERARWIQRDHLLEQRWHARQKHRDDYAYWNYFEPTSEAGPNWRSRYQRKLQCQTTPE